MCIFFFLSFPFSWVYPASGVFNSVIFSEIEYLIIQCKGKNLLDNDLRVSPTILIIYQSSFCVGTEGLLWRETQDLRLYIRNKKLIWKNNEVLKIFHFLICNSNIKKNKTAATSNFHSVTVRRMLTKYKSDTYKHIKKLTSDKRDSSRSILNWPSYNQSMDLEYITST